MSLKKFLEPKNAINKKIKIPPQLPFKNCSNLHALNISHNRVSGDGAIALSGCIKNLSSLIINSNKLGDKGALSLGDALRHCENLHTLNIRYWR